MICAGNKIKEKTTTTTTYSFISTIGNTNILMNISNIQGNNVNKKNNRNNPNDWWFMNTLCAYLYTIGLPLFKPFLGIYTHKRQKYKMHRHLS